MITQKVPINWEEMYTQLQKEYNEFKGIFYKTIHIFLIVF